MTIHDDAQAILDFVAGTITAPPARQYSTLGQVAWDCEQLVVTLVGLGKNTRDGSGRMSATTLPSACVGTNVVATVLQTWCVPTGEASGNRYRAPTDDALSAAGETAINGAQELWHAVNQAAGLVDCRPYIVDAVALGPEGGYVGFQITVEWALTNLP